jgi:hypothetical protein
MGPRKIKAGKSPEAKLMPMNPAVAGRSGTVASRRESL